MTTPPTKLFVFVDNSVLIRIATQGEKGCEPELWDDLKQHVARGAVELLVPEVTRLEFRAKRPEVSKKMETSCEELKKYIDESSLYNELTDLKGVLGTEADKFLKQRVADFEQRCTDIDEYISGGQVTAIALDEKILLRYRKRSISHKLPDSPSEKRKQQNVNDYWSHDTFCIDSLIEFLSAHGYNLDECRLAICTDNLGDYAVIEGEPKGDVKGIYKEGLPKATEVFKTLQQMSKFLEGAPTPPEVVEEVKHEVEREEARVAAEMTWHPESFDWSLPLHTPFYLDSQERAIRELELWYNFGDAIGDLAATIKSGTANGWFPTHVASLKASILSVEVIGSAIAQRLRLSDRRALAISEMILSAVAIRKCLSNSRVLPGWENRCDDFINSVQLSKGSLPASAILRVQRQLPLAFELPPQNHPPTPPEPTPPE